MARKDVVDPNGAVGVDGAVAGGQVRVISLNMCLISPGGTLRRPIHGWMCGFATSLTLVYWTVQHYLQLPVWGVSFPLLLLVAFVMSFFWAHVIWSSVSYVFVRWLGHEHKRARIDLFIQRVHDAAPRVDVLVLQELSDMWSSSRHTRRVLRECAALGFVHVASCDRFPTAPATLGNAGLHVVSRYPIVESAFHAFHTKAWFDYFAVSRGALYANVMLPDAVTGRRTGGAGTPMHVFTVHMAPAWEMLLSNVDWVYNSGFYAWLSPYITDALTVQLNQARELTTFMRQHVPAVPNALPKPPVYGAARARRPKRHSPYVPNAVPTADAKPEAHANGNGIGNGTGHGHANGNGQAVAAAASAADPTATATLPLVVFAGDVNVKAGTPIFTSFAARVEALGWGMRDELRVVDPRTGASTWPVTFGMVDADGKPCEVMLTSAGEQGVRWTLDAVFTNHTHVHPNGRVTAGVARFARDESEPLRARPDLEWQQVSDHYAVDFTLTF